MFGVILAFVFTAMLGYVFWRAASVPLIRVHISRKRLIAAAVAPKLAQFSENFRQRLKQNRCIFRAGKKT